MTFIPLDEAAEYIGIRRTELNKIIKNGRELHSQKQGRRLVVDKGQIDAWKALKEKRTFELTRAEFLKAFKFALKINYHGSTRADFGNARQRSITQSVENWTQGALAEVALARFIKDKFGVGLELDFTVRDVIVGQDIVEVIRGRVSNPPHQRISIKSGKKNGMLLIVPENEVSSNQRVSDYYVFVRILYDNDFILRLLREHPDLSDIENIIPKFGTFKAEIAGYCAKADMEYRTVPEAGISEFKYVKPTGLLKNSDNDWQIFVNQL